MKPLESQSIIPIGLLGLYSIAEDGRRANYKFIIRGHFVFQRHLIWGMLCLEHTRKFSKQTDKKKKISTAVVK